jgi:hypothetical protein
LATQRKPVRVVLERRWDDEGRAVYRASVEGKPTIHEEDDSRAGALGLLMIWHADALGLELLPLTETKPEPTDAGS